MTFGNFKVFKEFPDLLFVKEMSLFNREIYFSELDLKVKVGLIVDCNVKNGKIMMFQI